MRPTPRTVVLIDNNLSQRAELLTANFNDQSTPVAPADCRKFRLTQSTWIALRISCVTTPLVKHRSAI